MQIKSKKGLQAIRHCKNKNLKSAVIRFSGFTHPSGSICADKSTQFIGMRIWAFITIHGRNTANMKLETKLRLT
jgi:hypothetical protein